MPNSETESRRVVAWAGGSGKQGDAGQRIQTCSCKMSGFWGSNGQHGDYSQQYCILYFKVAKILNILTTHTQKGNYAR